MWKVWSKKSFHSKCQAKNKVAAVHNQEIWAPPKRVKTKFVQL
jgi:hypothetical protein